MQGPYSFKVHITGIDLGSCRFIGGPDAKDKFQQISAAYKFLTEGDQFLEEQMEDDHSDFFWIFKFMFPWMFNERPREPSWFSRPDPSFFSNDSSSDEFERDSHTPPRGAYANSRTFNNSTYRQKHSNFENFYGKDECDDSPRRSYSRARQRSYTSNTYTSQERPSESGASQHYRMYANFEETNQEQGQFYQNNSKSSKRRNKNARKAKKERADEAKSQNAFSSAAHARAKSPQERNHPQKSQASGGEQEKNHSQKSQASVGEQQDQNKKPPQKVEKGNSNPSEKQEKKSTKKELQQKQRKREKELREIREELERKEQEKKEKLERKKKAQEEKERIEREKQEEEERKEMERRQEEQRKLEERRRQQREKEEKERQERLQREKERREKEREEQERERKRKELFAEFDRQTLIDDNGEFKVTDDNFINLIRRNDLNQIRHVDNNKTNVKSINGLKMEDLIKLQTAAEQKPTSNRDTQSIRNLIHGEPETSAHRSGSDGPRQSKTVKNDFQPSSHATEPKESQRNVFSVGQQSQQQYTHNPEWPQLPPHQYQAQQQQQLHQYWMQQQQQQPRGFVWSATPQASAWPHPVYTQPPPIQPVFQCPPPLRPLSGQGFPRYGPQLPRSRPQRFANTSRNTFASPTNQTLLNGSSHVTGVHFC
ncbi:reticulocyte binding protein 2 homolog b [Plakobranchus ocellatus]|uniref:Reticulocyte binding protein 2 homolog b n=1 Tax=Plakobranchus ocellatus TaxID=259542 RepID=A0AAV3YA53_9GAST|nr:reticulocyte binding protein 2 homolog b [Plakobranchus ocellatus]